jgi:CBS domain-containing membrane protein
MGASAVLLFAVPASPLAQPWPIFGGNVVSAGVGVAVAYAVPEPALAAGLAVGLAIALMSFMRCLHPPGGAAALVAVFAASSSSHLLFPLVPVGINAALLVALGWGFHRLSGRAYPHRTVTAAEDARKTNDPTPLQRVGFRAEDVDAALANLGETFDISREDINTLLRQVEMQAISRTHPDLTCADVMSKDVISVSHMADPAAARHYLLNKDLRTLPVVDDENRVLGMVGFRQLQRPAARVSGMMEKAVTAHPDTPVMSLMPRILNGHTHAVIVVGDDQKLEGIVTQTDLLAAMLSQTGTQREAA